MTFEKLKTDLGDMIRFALMRLVLKPRQAASKSNPAGRKARTTRKKKKDYRGWRDSPNVGNCPVFGALS